MSAENTKENIRANRNKIKGNLKYLVSKFQEKQPELIYYKIQRSLQTSSKAQKLHNITYNQSVININGVNFLKTKSLFENQYTKLRKIGEGSQSVVYLCQEKATGAKYVAKMLANVDEEKAQAIKDKFQILSGFNHHQIIKSKAVFINQNEKTCHLILQYSPFPTLRQFMVQNKGKIQEYTVWKIIKSILSGIKILNQKNIFHRDLKPQNLLYNPTTGLIKIIDFETAKRITVDDILSTQTGTLLYRAPQTFIGSSGTKIDIWSIGIISYEMMFSILPFYSQNQRDAIKYIRQRPLELNHLCCSYEMQNLLSYLLQKSQTDRISVQDALSLIDEKFEGDLIREDNNFSISTTNSMLTDEIQSPPVIDHRIKRPRKNSQPIIFCIGQNRFDDEHMEVFIN